MSADVAAGEASQEGNLMERLRRDGLQTVTKLLQDARAENKILKDKNAQLEKTVGILTGRLQKAGISDTHFSASLDDSPLPSRALVEGFIRENAKLRKQVAQPQKVEELTMHVYSLQNLNRSLKEAKEDLQNELDYLKQKCIDGKDDKNREIVYLNDMLKQLRQEFQQEHQLRITLTSEIERLKLDLSETARRCLNISSKLPSNTIHSDLEPDLRHTPQLANIGVSTAGHLAEKNRELELRCRKLDEELSITRTQLKQLQSIKSGSLSLEKVVEENSLLKRQLMDKDRELSRMVDEQKALKHQLEVFQEDFRMEQVDRKKTVEKNSELERQLKKSSLQKGSVNFQESPSTASQRHTIPYRQKPDKTDSHKKPLGPTTVESRVLVEPDNISLSSQTDIVRPKSDVRTKNTLACFKCGKQYSKETHSELVDHLNLCKGHKH